MITQYVRHGSCYRHCSSGRPRVLGPIERQAPISKACPWRLDRSPLKSTGNPHSPRLTVADIPRRSEAKASLDVYAAEFGRTGFQGALNWYRIGAGKYAAELGILSGRTIDVPALFIAGAAEWTPYMVPGNLERMQATAFARGPPGRVAGISNRGIAAELVELAVACVPRRGCADRSHRRPLARRHIEPDRDGAAHSSNHRMAGANDALDLRGRTVRRPQDAR